MGLALVMSRTYPEVGGCSFWQRLLSIQNSQSEEKTVLRHIRRLEMKKSAWTFCNQAANKIDCILYKLWVVLWVYRSRQFHLASPE